MTIHVFLDDEITVRRLKTVSGNQKDFKATATVWGDVQALSPNDAEVIDLHPSRAFKIFVDISANISEGDKLQWEEILDEGINETSRTRQFKAIKVNQPKTWLSDYKEIIAEELLE